MKPKSLLKKFTQAEGKEVSLSIIKMLVDGPKETVSHERDKDYMGTFAAWQKFQKRSK